MANISIDSIGKFAGGTYDSIWVNGIGTGEGDAACKEFSVNGCLTMQGSVKAKETEINGMAKLDGNLSAEKLSVNGSLKVSGWLTAEDTEISGAVKADGDARVDDLTVNGAFSVDGALTAGDTEINGKVKAEYNAKIEDLSVYGEFYVGGSLEASVVAVDGNLNVQHAANFGTLSCGGYMQIREGLFVKAGATVDGTAKITGNFEAECIDADGILAVTGQISADQVTINGSVRADEIVGDYVELSLGEPRNWFANLFGKSFSGSWSRDDQNENCANLIEATTVVLENVRVGMVNGENVTIGPNCRVDRVGCSGTLEIDPSSTVGEILRQS